MHARLTCASARASVGAATILTIASITGAARAGGSEIPDNGAQALGRGAAFVAKADDSTAIYYNPAGLARQRGTRLYGGANLALHSFSFQRIGTFPDDASDAQTPWGGRPYPKVSSSSGLSVVPFIAASTDFATFDRFVFAVGLFGPPALTERKFPIAVLGAPASSRYDFVESHTSILLPTASAAFRVTRWLDVGLSGHLVLASFDQTMVDYVDTGKCPRVEYQPCDARSRLTASATSFAGTFGVLVRPTASVAIGASVRSPVSLDGDGKLDAQTPKGATDQLGSGSAKLTSKLPLIARLGARYVAMDGNFERYDLELDGTYEAWSGEGNGPRASVPDLGAVKGLDLLVDHHWKDTFSARAGGAYDFEVGGGVLALRAGGYFDSSATSFKYTRIDVDTLAKIAGTLGLGYRRGAFAFDVGYAVVASVRRLVGTGQGDVRPLNLAKGGNPVGNDDRLLPVVNEGAYRGFTNLFGAALTVTFDELFGARRRFHFGNAYEAGYEEPGEGPKEEPKAEPKAEPKVEPKVEPKAEPKVEPKVEPKAEPKVEPKAEKKPEKKPEKPAEVAPPKKDLEKPPETPKKVEKPPEKKPEKPVIKKKEWWEELD